MHKKTLFTILPTLITMLTLAVSVTAKDSDKKPITSSHVSDKNVLRIPKGAEGELTTLFEKQTDAAKQAVRELKELLQSEFSSTRTVISDYGSNAIGIAILHQCQKSEIRYYYFSDVEDNKRAFDIMFLPSRHFVPEAFMASIYLSPKIMPYYEVKNKYVREYDSYYTFQDAPPVYKKDWKVYHRSRVLKGHPLRLRLGISYGKAFPEKVLLQSADIYERAASSWDKLLLVEDPINAYKKIMPFLKSHRKDAVFSDNIASKETFQAIVRGRYERIPKDVFMRYKNHQTESFLYYRNEDLNNDGHLDYAITDTKDNGNIALSSWDSDWMIFLNDGTNWYFYVNTIVLNPSFSVEPLQGDKSAIAMESYEKGGGDDGIRDRY